MMKKILNILSVVLVTLLLVTSCESDPIKFDTSYGVVGFESSSVVIREDATGEVKIYLGGVIDLASTDVTVEVSIEGISKPAIEGEDFTLSSKTINVSVGDAAITINPIDNDLFEGDKKFKLKIVSNSLNYLTSVQDEVLVTLSDDEHPLKLWLGEWEVEAISYDGPGAYDETWQVIIAPLEGDETGTMISITGVSGSDSTIVGTIDKSTFTITIESGQDLGEVYGSGNANVGLYNGDEMKDITWREVPSAIFETASVTPIVGTVAEDGSSISIDGWAHLLVDTEAIETETPWIYDVFNTTWTKK